MTSFPFFWSKNTPMTMASGGHDIIVHLQWAKSANQRSATRKRSVFQKNIAATVPGSAKGKCVPTGSRMRFPGRFSVFFFLYLFFFVFFCVWRACWLRVARNRAKRLEQICWNEQLPPPTPSISICGRRRRRPRRRRRRRRRQRRSFRNKKKTGPMSKTSPLSGINKKTRYN